MKGRDSTDASPGGHRLPHRSQRHRTGAGTTGCRRGARLSETCFLINVPPNQNVRSCASLHHLTSQHPHHAPRPLSLPQAGRTSVSPVVTAPASSPPHRPCLSSPEPLESLPRVWPRPPPPRAHTHLFSTQIKPDLRLHTSPLEAFPAPEASKRAVPLSVSP